MKILFSGSVQGGDGQALFLTHITPELPQGLCSSAVSKGGGFTLSCTPENEEPAFYRIGFNEQNCLVTLAKKGEKINFNIKDASRISRHYTATGSKDAELMCELDQKLSLFNDSMEVLSSWYNARIHDDTLRAFIDSCYLLIKGHHTEYLRNFIHQNSNSLSIIIAFYQTCTMGAFFNEKEELELMETMLQSLKKNYPKNENVRWLQERIEKIRALQQNENPNV